MSRKYKISSVRQADDAINDLNDNIVKALRCIDREFDRVRKDAEITAQRKSREEAERAKVEMQNKLNASIRGVNARINQVDEEQRQRLHKVANEIYDTVIEVNKKYNIIPVCLALGDENKTIEIVNSQSNSYLSFNGKNKIDVDMVTLDKFVEDNNIEVGLIKTDLEGFEQPFLRGAINTIKKQKPTLIISIYHSYEDFFEIKPMIESWNLGYKFSIKKGSEFHEIVGTLLIAEIQ